MTITAVVIAPPGVATADRPLVINLRDECAPGTFERVLEVVPADEPRATARANAGAVQGARVRGEQARHVASRAGNRIRESPLRELLSDLPICHSRYVMEKSFEPRAIEPKWYAQWEAHGYFAPGGNGEPYCILLPPPNVTGTLHMGHAFQQTLMDALIRYHRMRGFSTLWQGGTDHAGIATQKVVENQLAAKDKTRHDLGRAKFIERVWEWKEESGSTITRQMRRLGASGDWSRERFTMDEGLSAAVRRVFVEWYARA